MGAPSLSKIGTLFHRRPSGCGPDPAADLGLDLLPGLDPLLSRYSAIIVTGSLTPASGDP
jgi:hypothetical protein